MQMLVPSHLTWPAGHVLSAGGGKTTYLLRFPLWIDCIFTVLHYFPRNCTIVGKVCVLCTIKSGVFNVGYYYGSPIIFVSCFQKGYKLIGLNHVMQITVSNLWYPISYTIYKIQCCIHLMHNIISGVVKDIHRYMGSVCLYNRVHTPISVYCLMKYIGW